MNYIENINFVLKLKEKNLILLFKKMFMKNICVI
jgi:hypothetical protein